MVNKIPQGTVLGPILFLTFINDLPQSLTCECSIFADDSTAYTAGKDTQLTCRKLSLNLDYAFDWASSWGMLFSAEKSEHLQIAPKTQNLSQSDVFMHGSYIPRVTTHKHLGVHINSRLSWQDHIDHVYTDCARNLRLALICAAYNVSSGQQLFGRSSSEQSDHGGVCLPRVERGKHQQVGQTPRTVLPPAPDCLTRVNCNSDLTITHWCCSSRSSRTWPLLI